MTSPGPAVAVALGEAIRRHREANEVSDAAIHPAGGISNIHASHDRAWAVRAIQRVVDAIHARLKCPSVRTVPTQASSRRRSQWLRTSAMRCSPTPC